jgi:hypothetical protein
VKKMTMNPTGWLAATFCHGSKRTDTHGPPKPESREHVVEADGEVDACNRTSGCLEPVREGSVATARKMVLKRGHGRRQDQALTDPNADAVREQMPQVASVKERTRDAPQHRR